MKFSKIVILFLGTAMFVSACAKNKSHRRVARPAAGTAGFNNNAQTPTDKIPGFDDVASSNTKLETGSLSGVNERVPQVPAEQFLETTQQTAHPVTSPQMQTASESEVNGEPPNDGGNHNAECGTAYRANNDMWYPGLPFPPSQVRICTGHGGGQVSEEEMYKCEAGNGYVYTDARQDGLMSLVAQNYHKLPAYLDAPSRRLSRRIQDVTVQSNLFKVGSVNVTIALFAGKDAKGKNRYNHIRLAGSIKKSGRAKLHAVGNANYGGELTCADVSGTCDNAILRLDHVISRDEVLRPAKTGKNKKNAMIKKRIRKRAGVGAIAFIVIRNGDAHVTMSEAERRGYRSLNNQAHQLFAQIMSNTVNNTCLNILSDLREGRRKIPRCAYQRLQQECARSSYHQPAAAEFNLRTWAVVHGRAGFEFSMMNDAGDAKLSIRGPLVATNAKPMWSRPLKISGPMAAGIENAFLVANDGGGNLNLQLDFNGQYKAQSRVSVTSISNDVRFGASSSEANQAQVPEVETSALAEQGDVQAAAGDEQQVEGDDEKPATSAPAVAQPVPEPPVTQAPLTQPVDKGTAAPAAQAPAASEIPAVDDSTQTHTSGSFDEE
jgi:hypothetical protein